MDVTLRAFFRYLGDESSTTSSRSTDDNATTTTTTTPTAVETNVANGIYFILFCLSLLVLTILYCDMILTSVLAVP